MLIRQETPADYDAVYHVVKAAFETAAQSDGTEQELVTALRRSSSFIPSLSLVAVENGMIVGHILFSKATVSGHPVLALAPLSVLPSYQNKGVGLALVNAGHRAAQILHYDFSVVLGHPNYYPKAGYVPAEIYGIYPPFEVPGGSFMAYKLNDKAKNIEGIIQYDNAFDIHDS